MAYTRPPKRKIGLLPLTVALAVLVWLAGGFVLLTMLAQQTRMENDAQRIYDGSSARFSEAARAIRGLEHLAREGDTLIWVNDSAMRTLKRQRMQSLQSQAPLQGEPEIRAVVDSAFATMDENLADLAANGSAAQERSAARWAPVMQQILNQSETVGAKVADVATREADQILQSIDDARTMLVVLAGLITIISMALLGFVYFMLTRPVVRLAEALVTARDGKPIADTQEVIHELQMLHDAALALGGAHRDLETTRAQLEQLAHTDALTGLANRRQFEQEGERAFSRTQRYGEVLVVIIFDIDHFKRINDQFGHDGGDVVLRALGDYLREAIRSAELPVARIGGEEFALLLTHSPLADALLMAERLRAGIEALPVVMPNGATLHFTVSMGIAQYRAPDSNLSTLLRRADMALYRAKENGRNRIEQAP